MDIERTFDDNVYTNVDDDSVFPLLCDIQKSALTSITRTTQRTLTIWLHRLKVYMSVALFIDIKNKRR